jgi:hypothetical protein
MKKIIFGFLLLSVVALSASGCGMFKKGCNCPHFEVKK